MKDSEKSVVRETWDEATHREVPDAIVGSKLPADLSRRGLLKQVGRVAAVADPVPSEVTQTARDAFSGFDRSMDILDEDLF